jgi:GT2 family glycosyltransferase
MDRGADAVLLLNNDTVVSPTLLSSFVQGATAHPDAAVFGAKIYFYDEPTTLWHAGGNVHPRFMRCYHDGCGDNDLEKRWDTIRSINYACGCALFVKREAMEKVGLIAPEFFLLWEEIDWCWRIRKSGYDCLYLPQAKVWHKISRSFEGGNRGPLWQYYYFRNRLLFLRRNVCFKQRLHFYFTAFIKEIGQMVVILLNPKTTKESAKRNIFALMGIRDHFLRK